MFRKRITLTVVLASLGLVAASQATQATVLTYFLSNSNVESSLPDGPNYAQVTIDDSIANQITFTVTLLSPLTSIQGSNFGIQDFSFNVIGTGAGPILDASGSNSQWTLPSGWSANVAPPTNQADGFGRFDVQVGSTGSARLSPLTFTLLNTGLTAASFAEVSTNGNGQGNVYFSAHVTGFVAPGGVTSGYFGGSSLNAVPLPGAAFLLLSGLAGLSGFRKRRHV